MHFQPTRLPGLLMVTPVPREDARGSFTRLFCAEAFHARGLETQFIQLNQCITLKAGTIRGLHYQLPPAEETKLVRCLRGRVWDVVVDMRAGSPTYRQYEAVELDGSRARMLYVPAGCAHGYQALEADSEVLYLSSAGHAPHLERGVSWNDPSLGLPWPLPVEELSEKDRSWPWLPVRPERHEAALTSSEAIPAKI